MKLAKNLLKKPLLYLLALLVLGILFLPKSVQAQGSSTQDTYINAIQSSGYNVTKWSDNIIEDTFYHLTKRMVGLFDAEGEPVEVGLGPKIFAFGGEFYKNKPSIGQRYVAEVIERSGFIQKAYAQTGQGWDFLSGVLRFWVVMRNLAYLCFVIVFIVIGFMIMFRSKINPQTVISIQNALPKIVISLLLVTFSFAICSFLVDLVWVGNGVIDYLFDPAIPGGPHLLQDLVKSGWAYNHADANYNLLDVIFNWSGGNGLVSEVFVGLGEILAAGATSGSTTTSVGGFLKFIIAFVILSTSIKIFFALATRYITIIFYTIFSPFIFLFNSIKGSINNFFSEMLASTLSFPAIYALLNLSSYFAQVNKTTSQANVPLRWLEPFRITSTTGNFDYTLNQLVALGILMVIPTVPQAIEKALEAKSALPDTGFGDIMGAIRKVPIIGQLFG